MRMRDRRKLRTVLSLIIFLSLVLHNTSRVEGRKREKRFLRFPPKSNVVLTMALLKLLPTESIANTLTEFDALFPVPLHPFQNDLHPRRKRDLERNVILSKLREMGDHFGFDGNLCLRKFLCRMSDLMPSTTEQEDNVLRDIIDIIFEPSTLIPKGCVNETQNLCHLY